MGKLLGFLDYDRCLPSDRDPLERVHDWDEIHKTLALEEQKEQAARCMYCSIPFCHSGIVMNGAVSGCPLHNLIPEWNDLLYRDQWNTAADRLLRTDSFPEFTGRVCPAPCEGACTCGIYQPPVTIRQNELMLIERAFESDHVKPRIPKRRSGKRVAVVGSGPSGLAAANVLNQLGHVVTVFERADRIGGLLMYGIPNMKLDKKFIDRRVDLMKQEGITFEVNENVGVDKPVKELRQNFDAIVLCCGSTKPRDLNVPGREGKGVVFAVDYLTAATKKLLDQSVQLPDEMNARDRDVIVIGGGDTGTDCVGTALRQGCRTVVQFEIMPEPGAERAADNPWPEFPRILKIDYAQEEAIAKYGKDPRNYLINTREIVRKADGSIAKLITDRIEWVKNESGRMTPQPAAGTQKEWKAEIVLLAMGYLGPEDTLANALKLSRDKRSNIEAFNYQTNQKGVFVAGDMHSGQSLVVRAVNEGQLAAAACHEYLTK
ncbi:MAG: glutamate synthase subunit beta [Clostridiales bacterium]|nr:glutamate synthase subunit beta [Clostridiales bacterium]